MELIEAHAGVQLPTAELQLGIRDLDHIRNFISGGGPAAFSDLPFLPVQIIICFLIHPFIGWATVFGATVIFFLTLATDLSVRRLTLQVSEKSMMPEGLEQNLTPQDLADLIAYLNTAPHPFGSATAELNHQILGFCNELNLKAIVQDPRMTTAIGGDAK